MKSWYTIFHWGAPTTGKKLGAGTAVMFALAVREGSDEQEGGSGHGRVGTKCTRPLAFLCL